jgi:predicted cobalt transporter CbtA
MPKTRFDAAVELLATGLLWGMAGFFTLLFMLSLCVAAVIFAVALGPFFAIGELAEWWRNRSLHRTPQQTAMEDTKELVSNLERQ